MQGDCSVASQLMLRTFLVPIDHEALFKDITKGKQRRKLVSRIFKSIGIYILPLADNLCKSTQHLLFFELSFLLTKLLVRYRGEV